MRVHLTGTVLCRIKKIADSIKKPAIAMERVYEVDELKTFIKNKTKECWVIYALDKQSNQVVDLKVGSRTNKNLKRVTDTPVAGQLQTNIYGRFAFIPGTDTG